MAIYCSRCGKRIIIDKIDLSAINPLCNCGNPAFKEGTTLASCAILTFNSSILLVKRKYEPKSGLWCLPGGLVESNEHPICTAIREVYEEVGLSIEVQQLLGIYVDKNIKSPFDTIVMVYIAHVEGGEIMPGEEVVKIQLFSPNKLPWTKLAFGSTLEALIDWTEKCREKQPKE